MAQQMQVFNEKGGVFSSKERVQARTVISAVRRKHLPTRPGLPQFSLLSHLGRPKPPKSGPVPFKADLR